MTAAAIAFPASSPRPVMAEFVRVFNLTDGRAVALDKRSVGFVRQEDDGGVTIGLKLSGQRPMPIKANFSEVYQWWVAPTKMEGESHAAAVG